MLKACGTNILLEITLEERLTPGGLVLPRDDNRMQIMKVVSVGAGYEGDEPPCKIGDNVLIDYYREEKVLTKDDRKFVFVDFCDIMAIEEDD